MGLPFFFTDRASKAVEHIIELRREQGLDPRIPDPWMKRLEWLGSHSNPDDVGPRMLAAIVVAADISFEEG